MSTVAQPAEKFATVNGLKIHYLEWGSAAKPSMILVHGIARMARLFGPVAERLANDFHVIAVDMRGHGDSDWHPDGAYVVEDYTSDIEGLIEQLGLRNVVLWGASTGGRAVQLVAGRHPAWVRAVIVEDVGPERPTAVSNRRGNRMAKEVDGWASTEALLEYIRVDTPRAPAWVARMMAEQGTKPRADGRVVWKRDPAILKGFVPTELWGTVSKITAPIVYVLGGLSKIVPPETQQALRVRLPQSQIVMMANLGHYPSDEDPDEFVAIVRRFLASVRG